MCFLLALAMFLSGETKDGVSEDEYVRVCTVKCTQVDCVRKCNNRGMDDCENFCDRRDVQKACHDACQDRWDEL